MDEKSREILCYYHKQEILGKNIAKQNFKLWLEFSIFSTISVIAMFVGMYEKKY